MTLYLKYAARSDRGLVRQNNQDSVYAGPRLLAVADGMGGHVGGEVASKVVIAAVEYLDEDAPSANMLAALREATGYATDHLREVVHDKPELDGMGTTLTALLFGSSRIALCHVGDSRAYQLRAGKLTQITHDDTFVQALIDEGRITEEEASVHPQRSVILRALNGADVDPDLSIREARVGDRYLLCSDGLTSFVSKDTVLDGLSIDDPDDAADRLIDLALRAGGPDNVTVIVADVVDDEDGETAPDSPVVDGAAGNNQGQRENTGSTPASRAALVTQAESVASASEDAESPDGRGKPAKRRPWSITALVIAVALTGLFFIARSYINAQYFVGTRGSDVVIYNGVSTAIGPIDLYSVVETTKYKVADLNQATKQSLARGIDAASLHDARKIVSRLDDQLLPLCTASSTPTPTPPPSASSSAAASSAPSAESSSSESASPTNEKPGINCRGGG
ncbi:MAG: PP2C family serine/threonine-protein phosphatase [Antricoccus sp.]